MKIFLVTLLVTFMVFLDCAQSASSSRQRSLIPDLNYQAENPEDERKVVRNPDGSPKGILYGKDLAVPIPNPDGTLWGLKFRGEYIKKVEWGNGAELYDWDNFKVGTYVGRNFYDGGRIVKIRNGYHLRVGGRRIATFETVWRYDEVAGPPRPLRYHSSDYPTGPSGAGLSIAGPSGEGPSRVGPDIAGPSGEGTPRARRSRSEASRSHSSGGPSRKK